MILLPTLGGFVQLIDNAHCARYLSFKLAQSSRLLRYRLDTLTTGRSGLLAEKV